MDKFSLFGKFTVDEANRDQLVDILLDAAESMKDLEECEAYIVSVAEEEADAVYVDEVWSDDAAHQSSLELGATQTLIAKAKPIITGMERISTLAVRGGKGVS
ncbi:putative quinol monooxygenase [Lacicoccus qingdaonensis]|uniref:Quinol monooxygenase YgiN n=1 Tax=Lacicoccus qingdaonensis TaxID=576118 RepID=A0A1G9IXY3_9BACL|nr:putative quinol monooxygenase [Salinicoccus qingdaonensis]SDL29813.1 Quinol monooxygenase YgiN [Salinicoccus qingdaonensis]